MDDIQTPKKRPFKQKISPLRYKNTSSDFWDGLDMSNQGIKNISVNLFTFTFIKHLYLNDNALTKISPAISQLKNLIFLDISRNYIRSLPPDISKLVNLKELHASDNLISSVPLQLGNLYQLQRLNLNNNPLIEPYSTFYSQSEMALLSFCREHNTVYPVPTEREWLDYENNTDSSFTVGTYNILCPAYATHQLFSYVPKWILAWENRRDAILQQINEYKVDILCLQEIDVTSYNDYFKPCLTTKLENKKISYDSLFYPKGRYKTMSNAEKNGVDGCAIFYNKNLFTSLETKCIEFNSSVLSDKRFYEREDIINRNVNKDNVGVVCVLRVNEHGNICPLNYIIVVNVHLCWDPEYGDVKLFQSILTVEEIEKMYAVYSNKGKCGIILCGDFNSPKSTNVYKMITNGKITGDFNGYDYGIFNNGFKHNLELNDAYNTGINDLTCCTPGFRGVIDYIFYGGNIKATGVLSGVDDDYLSKIVGLPSVHFPSDHIFLGAKFHSKE